MSESGWSSAEEARERTREIVAGAFAKSPEQPPERTCPSCGHTASTWRGRCPACDKRYDRRLPWLSDAARWAIAALALIALGGVIAYAAPRIGESKAERAARLAQETKVRVDRERARLVREQVPVKGTLAAVPADDAKLGDAERLERRRAQMDAFSAAILADSRARVAQHRLDGNVKGVRCEPLLRTPDNARDENDLAKRRGRYDCVAITSDVIRDGKVIANFGHPFVGVITFATGDYVFCKDNKIPGERGKLLVKVKLDASCVGAEGARELGDGFILEGDLDR